MLTSKEVQVGTVLQATSKKSYQRALAERGFDDNAIHNDDYTKGAGLRSCPYVFLLLCGYTPNSW